MQVKHPRVLECALVVRRHQRILNPIRPKRIVLSFTHNSPIVGSASLKRAHVYVRNEHRRRRFGTENAILPKFTASNAHFLKIFPYPKLHMVSEPIRNIIR